VFFVRLPRVQRDVPKISRPERATSADAPDLSGLALWAVDDEQAVRDAMQALLSRWHVRARLFARAEDLLAALEDEIPDVVLADHDLGDGLSGLDLIERLLARGGIHVALLSALQSHEVLDRAEAMGVTIMPKPVDPSALQAWLREI
ncbi:MAG: response regulator, partial [Litorimonas sp.]